LKNIEEIYTTKKAFAAININGDVITKGNPEYGGDSSKVQHLLKNIKEIQSFNSVFVAISENNNAVV